MYELRLDFIEIMDIIQSKLNLETPVHQSSGYKRQLSNKSVIYWLEFLHQIMPHVLIFEKLDVRIQAQCTGCFVIQKNV